jgi:hypothetical protein
VLPKFRLRKWISEKGKEPIKGEHEDETNDKKRRKRLIALIGMFPCCWLYFIHDGDDTITILTINMGISYEQTWWTSWCTPMI